MKTVVLFIFCITSLFAFSQKRITVSLDGKGDYKTVQEAVDAVPNNNTKPIIIFIKKGIYKEPVVVDARKSFITLLGEKKDEVVLTYNNHAGTKSPNGDTLNTWTCASTFIYANDFTAKNIHFENNAGFTAGQAVAVRAEGNRLAFKDCSFTGFQDVLFLSGNGVKQYFENCYIEGTTDFIFGAATAVFKNCHIHSKKNSHVTAASTNSIMPFGFVFFNCVLTADSNITNVSLGRPWSPTASVAYINCVLGKHINTDGWNNWKNPNNENTARFAEYKSLGDGAGIDKRVKWSKQLNDEQVKKYTVENILGNWKPD